MEHTPPPRGYCTKCGYSLQGLTASPTFRCPECGRTFDPSDPKTFQLHPHGRVIRWLAKPIGWPLVLLSLAAAGGVMLVSRWKWGTFTPSTIDLIYYLRPAALRHRSSLITQNDWIYTLSMLAAVAICAWWLLRLLGNALARLLTGPKTDPPIHLGRRHALMALGVAIASAGAALGWPYRLAQQWVAQRMARGNLKFGRRMFPVLPPPGNPSPAQNVAMLRAAVIQMPHAAQRLAGLQLLIEDYPVSALPILTEAVALERDSQVKVLEIQLIGLHRNVNSLDLLKNFLTHDNSATRAAAADAIGLLHAPAFDIPPDQGFFGSDAAAIAGGVQIDLQNFLESQAGNRPYGERGLPMDAHPIHGNVRDILEHMMLAGATVTEREAAARALLVWPSETYKLRIAEWGVWISDDGELKLIQSVLDEIPPFVHRTGNPLKEFSDRINQIRIVTKPILHITVDRPLPVDVNVVIDRGRPWFAYPMPDDFAVRVQTTEWMPNVQSLLSPLEKIKNAPLKKLSDIRQGYPWLTPEHIISGSDIGGMGSVNDLTAIGVRWQSIVASPSPLPWMMPPEVGLDPRFAWWKRLREVPSSWVSSRGETERFLYYDGPTLAPAPVRATLNGSILRLTFLIETSADVARRFPISIKANVPQSILLVRHLGETLSGQVISPPTSWSQQQPTIELKLADDTLHEQHVIDEFRRMLIAAGLTTPEADGLIDAWRPQFFQTPGTRLLVIMARADYDALCPIEIRPKPTELERVGIILTEFA